MVEPSGKDVILIETVGVGQDEIDIVRLADITIVVLVPGMGDDVQSIKAGIMEIADIFVLNKSDREGADRLEKEVRAMQSLASRHADWVPPIVRTVASTGDGLVELAVEMENSAVAGKGRTLEARRQAFWSERLREMIQDQLLRELGSRGFSEASLSEIAAQVETGTENPYRLVPRLMSRVLSEENSHAARIAEK